MSETSLRHLFGISELSFWQIEHVELVGQSVRQIPLISFSASIQYTRREVKVDESKQTGKSSCIHIKINHLHYWVN